LEQVRRVKKRRIAAACIIAIGASLSIAAGVLPKTDEECANSLSCQESGACSAEWGYCTAASNIDCWISDVCRSHGRCTMQEGHCVAGSRFGASERFGVPPKPHRMLTSFE